MRTSELEYYTSKNSRCTMAIVSSNQPQNTTSRHTYSIVADILQKCHINYWCIKLPSVFEGVLDTTLCDKVRQSLAAGW
jgi:hypothetical protein